MNRYLEKLAAFPMSGVFKTLGRGVVSAGKDATGYVGKTISQASGKELMDHVNHTYFAGKATPKQLQEFTTSASTLRKIKKLNKGLDKKKPLVYHSPSGEYLKNPEYHPQGVAMARKLIEDSRNAKVKLLGGIAAAAYGGKKVKDKVSPAQVQYYNY